MFVDVNVFGRYYSCVKICLTVVIRRAAERFVLQPVFEDKDSLVSIPSPPASISIILNIQQSLSVTHDVPPASGNRKNPVCPLIKIIFTEHLQIL